MADDSAVAQRSTTRVGIRYFFEPPVLRKEKPADETGMFEDWVEFVADLIFVAFLFKLGNVMKYCGPSEGVLITLGLFLTFWRTMQSMLQYIDAVKSDDLARLLFMALILLGMFQMALNVNEGSNEGYQSCRMQ